MSASAIERLARWAAGPWATEDPAIRLGAKRHSHAECRMLTELVETTHGPSRWPAATLPIILLKRWRQRRGAAGHRWVILGPRRVLGRGEGYAAQPRDGGGNEYGVDDDAEPELPIPEQHQKHG